MQKMSKGCGPNPEHRTHAIVLKAQNTAGGDRKYVIAARQGEGYKMPFLRLDTFITINHSYLAHTRPVKEEIASKDPTLHKALPCSLNPPFYKVYYNKSQSESKKQNSKTSVGL